MENLSPAPIVEPELMSFPQAIQSIIENKKIRRIEWPHADYALLKDAFLMIYKNGEFFKWLVNDGDLLATDWIVLDDKN